MSHSIQQSTTLVLSLAGGFFLGGLVTGLVAQLIVAGISRQKMPRWVLNSIRLLGGLTVAMLLFHFMGGGGSGLGGPGGWGGSGSGTGTVEKDSTTAQKTRETNPEIDLPAGTTPLEIEVLGNDAVEKIAGRETVASQRYYRLRQQEGSRLLTLDEIKKLINPEGEPKWRYVILVLYLEDGPDREVSRVRDLKKWAEGLRVKDPPGNVKVDTVTRPGKTPSK